MNTTLRNMLIWCGIAFGLFVVFNLMTGSATRQNQAVVAFSQFMQDVEHDRVKEVNLAHSGLVARMSDGQACVTYVPEGVQIVPKLLEKGVVVKVIPPDDASLLHLLLPWLPMILIGLLTFYSFRQMQSGGNKAMGFGRSRARLVGETSSRVTFEDVAGIDEAKHELEEIVDFLKDPQKFQRLGGRIPRGVLLVGPPGTGKTLLARAIAGEAGVPFFSISGSDFVEMFVGVGASRVRDMFEQAKKGAPCIVFIDEIDAVGRHRGVGMGGGNDEREQTLNQLLVEMDGFEETQGVILVAATNRPDILDPALLRPGRFDRQVTVPNPDVNGREQILKVHVRKVPLAPNVNLRVIARGTPGFSGAELRNLINEAALLSARQGKLAVGMHELEQAKDKVMMGAERRSLAMTEEDKKITAYHEAGHAIIGYFTSGSDPIHKATIIPRGRALGLVMRLPEVDRVSHSRKKLLADIMVATGGRLAEEMVFGYDEVTTGASSDIRMATELARHMVTEWGMSDRLGFQAYKSQSEGYYAPNAHLSPETVQAIDKEVQAILDECLKKAKAVLIKHKDAFVRVAEALLERETLTGDDIRIVVEQLGELPPLGEFGSDDVRVARIETLPTIGVKNEKMGGATANPVAKNGSKVVVKKAKAKVPTKTKTVPKTKK